MGKTAIASDRVVIEKTGMYHKSDNLNINWYKEISDTVTEEMGNTWFFVNLGAIYLPASLYLSAIQTYEGMYNSLFSK